MVILRRVKVGESDMTFLEKRYKHIFVDFDSTLYLWDNCPDRKSADDVSWTAMRLSKDTDCYDPNSINKLLVSYLRQSCAQIHLVTWVNFSFEAELKYDFINKYYPDLLIDYIACSSNENKLLLLRAYERAGNPRDTMLLIDDRYNVVQACRQEGFDVQEPQFIMGQIFKKPYRQNV